MTFLIIVAMLILYFVYKDNRQDINNHFKKKKDMQKIKKIVEEQDDEELKKVIFNEGSPADVALYYEMSKIRKQTKQKDERKKDMKTTTAADFIERAVNPTVFTITIYYDEDYYTKSWEVIKGVKAHKLLENGMLWIATDDKEYMYSTSFIRKIEFE